MFGAHDWIFDYQLYSYGEVKRDHSISMKAELKSKNGHNACIVMRLPVTGGFHVHVKHSSSSDALLGSILGLESENPGSLDGPHNLFFG